MTLTHSFLSHGAVVHGASIFDPTALLNGAGPFVVVLIMAIIFIETGLLFPFLPGDSLIFTAGLLSTALALPIPWLIVAVAAAAILGDSVGYAIGKRFGRRLFKDDARIFKTRYLAQSDAFFARYGAQSLVLARFVPIVRTFVPPVVGMSSMPYRRFFLWNAIGGIAWATIFAIAGYYLGQIPIIAANVDVISIGIVVLSVVPIAITLLRERARSKRDAAADAPTE